MLEKVDNVPITSHQISYYTVQPSVLDTELELHGQQISFVMGQNHT